MSSKDKKTLQLGMNPSTASGRLVKDILFRLAIQAGHTCHRCGGDLDRETFSIEHKVAWLDSEDPVGLFFDQKNIAFSHLRCNSADGKRVKCTTHGTGTLYKNGCRCSLCVAFESATKAKAYTPEKRSARYKRTGN